MNEHSSIIQNLHSKIKQGIINQDFRPGEKLPERELAQKYNVSRTPIRQVLQTLSSEGLVEFIPYKGAFIKDLTIKEFKDITQLRMVLETFAVEVCCDHISENILKQLEEIINKQKEAIRNNDVKEYSHLDQEFHHVIVKGTENNELVTFVELLNQKSYLSRIRTLSLHGQMERSLIDHKEILECIKLGDKEGARQKAAAHVDDALQKYISVHNIITSLK